MSSSLFSVSQEHKLLETHGSQPTLHDLVRTTTSTLLFTQTVTQHFEFRGVLEESSAVLRDMLKELEPTKASSFRGCPALHLRDSPLLVKDVIKACLQSKVSYIPHPFYPA